MEFRMGELFCGAGGLALGAKLAVVCTGTESYSIRHVWATDIDKDSCDTFRANICPDNPGSVVCKDIGKLRFNDLRKISEIDALSFGFPCNDFSVVGEQKGVHGIYGPLYQHGIKALRAFNPMWFLAENVGGLRNANDGATFRKILSELVSCGYNVVAHLFKMDKYGIPQRRHRIIIVGFRNDLNVTFGVPSESPHSKTDISAKKALETPPIPRDAHNQELTRQSKTVVERLRYIKPGENAFTADMPESLRLNVKGAKISQIYRRLEPDKPAYTITGSGGGGTHVYHWYEPRALTNRERARLQTFPDNFVFIGSKESVRRQIGMAVPPFMAKIVFDSILKSFVAIPYETITPNLDVPSMIDSSIHKTEPAVVGAKGD
ncbi:MAG: DNA cytosine methyltransferase [Deltaproteobacteria bacterium]|nr:DNA cytosine methyltransferase [Deltaproteobacteria bacterium]